MFPESRQMFPESGLCWVCPRLLMSQGDSLLVYV
jgi:hypothetical protein